MRSSTIFRLPVTHPAGQYDVIIGRDLLARVTHLAGLEGPIAVVTDSNVGPLYAHLLGDVGCLVTIPAGESHKTLSTVQTIYDHLLSSGIDRAGTVVALGGGVVGDVAGFVAATYMRGIDLVQCPTTLLAMVDAGVGGKTGVDLPQGKNLVGSFKQPVAVIADVATLCTLAAAELVAGLAEVVKHGLIANPGILERLESEPESFTSADLAALDPWQWLIQEAVRIKRDFVQDDPYELGRRALLNLGHTFAHAIESISDYSVRHGEAVAMGLVAAAHLSSLLGHCSPDLQLRIESLLTRLHLPTRIPAEFTPESIWRAMGSDKKRAAGKLRFVLLRQAGQAFVTADVPAASILETLASVSA